jgi:Ca2+:H+ antiporter
MPQHQIDNPWWTVVVPLLGVVAVGALAVAPGDSLILTIGFAFTLGACVFAAVHHAEIIAAKVGEPVGSIVLALAVTVLEVGLILSLMLTAPDGGATIARDTVYSAIIIITTGIVGLSLLLGNRRHFEQTIRIREHRPHLLCWWYLQ